MRQTAGVIPDYHFLLMAVVRPPRPLMTASPDPPRTSNTLSHFTPLLDCCSHSYNVIFEVKQVGGINIYVEKVGNKAFWYDVGVATVTRREFGQP